MGSNAVKVLNTDGVCVCNVSYKENLDSCDFIGIIIQCRPVADGIVASAVQAVEELAGAYIQAVDCGTPFYIVLSTNKRKAVQIVCTGKNFDKESYDLLVNVVSDGISELWEEICEYE